jgi:hypothetical protein
MLIVEMAMIVIGFGLLSASLVLYQTRTHDKEFLTRFWLGKSLLTAREYALNRVGFVICLVAILAGGLRLAFDFYWRR